MRRKLEILLEDIGPIKSAKISVKRFTVLAGPNGTGKTIANRLLYTSILTISRQLTYWVSGYIDRLEKLLDVWKYEEIVASEVIENAKFWLLKTKVMLNRADENTLYTEGRKLFEKFFSIIDDSLPLGDFLLKQAYNEYKSRLHLIFSSAEKDKSLILSEVFRWLLREEFSDLSRLKRFKASEGRFIFSVDDQSLITLNIKDTVRISTRYVSSLNAFRGSIYLEGYMLGLLPIGNMLFIREDSEGVYLPHRFVELYRVFRKSLGDRSSGVPMLDKLREYIKKILGGSFSVNEEEGLFFSMSQGIELAPEDVATGYRVIGGLEVIIRSVVPGIVLLFDEPETHLHPEWQVKMVNLLLELTKYGMSVIISTHSPYVVQAVRVISESKELEKDISYFLAHPEKDGVVVYDVSERPNLIIKELSRPFARLVWRRDEFRI